MIPFSSLCQKQKPLYCKGFRPFSLSKPCCDVRIFNNYVNKHSFGGASKWRKRLYFQGKRRFWAVVTKAISAFGRFVFSFSMFAVLFSPFLPFYFDFRAIAFSVFWTLFNRNKKSPSHCATGFIVIRFKALYLPLWNSGRTRPCKRYLHQALWHCVRKYNRYASRENATGR